ncbi:MAG: hypothetical protein ACK4M7_07380, partial [Burkholderiales bacterium]
MLSSSDQWIFNQLLHSIRNNEISEVSFTIGETSSSLSSKEAQTFADSLEVNHSATSLDIRENDLDDSKLIIILESLRRHPSLTALCINGNRLADEDVPALLDIIKDIPLLTKLDISNTDITARGVIEILKANIPLKELNLYGLPFENEDIKLLAKPLKTNRHLKSIYFASLSEITEKNYQILMDAFKANPFLEKLHFDATFKDNTHIYLKKIKLLSEFIRDNKTLKEIGLCEDIFNNKGTKLLADALQNNQTLTSIGLPSISTDGRRLLVEALNKNSSLISVNFPSGNNINPPGFVSKMRAIARGNKQKATELLDQLVNPKCTLSPEDYQEISTRKAAIKAILEERQNQFPINRYKALTSHMEQYEHYIANYMDNPLKTTGIAKNEPI